MSRNAKSEGTGEDGAGEPRRSSFSRMISSSFSKGRTPSITAKGAEQNNSTNPFDENAQSAEESQASGGSDAVSATNEDVDVPSKSTADTRSSQSTDSASRDTMPNQYSLTSLSKLLTALVEDAHTAWSLASSVLQTGDNMTIALNRTQEVGDVTFADNVPPVCIFLPDIMASND